MHPNCPIVISKTTNYEDGIINGTTGIYLDHSDSIMIVETESGRIAIPKMKQKLKMSDIYYYRNQFPVLTANCITVHRVQGLSLNKPVHIILDSTFFTEGQAYISLSRIANSNQIHILSFSENAFKTCIDTVELMEYITIY